MNESYLSGPLKTKERPPVLYRFRVGEKGRVGRGNNTLAACLVTAWDVLLREMLVDENATKAGIYQGDTFVGFLDRSGRLFDTERRQLAVILDHRHVYLTIPHEIVTV